MPPEAAALTDLEGHILAHLARHNGATAYDIMRLLASSPLFSLSASPGAVYPAVKRLAARGLLTAVPGKTGRREHGSLSITPAGTDAIRQWVLNIRPADLMPQDPLRTKLLFVDLLTPAEQQRWLSIAKEGLSSVVNSLSVVAPENVGDNTGRATASAIASARQRKSFIEKLSAEIGGKPKRRGLSDKASKSSKGSPA